MPTISSDGQSLTIDGRRVWLVSGAVHYARMPQGLWKSRLAAARDAGLNCIEAPVPWSRHEPRSGVFDFDGENNLAEFVRLIGAMGMHCILRAGPYIGDGYDLGGLPSWLIPGAGDRMRSGAPEFLQSCSRYIATLCAQVKDLQASNPRKRTGPIIMLLSEYQWLCGDPAAGSAYLGELNRFFRENGISVPIVGAHNLFHTVEGQIDAWIGHEHLHSTVRQMRSVMPDEPPIVAGLSTGAPALWGEAPHQDSPAVAMRCAAEALAAGAQININPFFAGMGLNLMAGRATQHERAGFIATDTHLGAPVNSAGDRGPVFHALRRVCVFASSFGRVFANLDGGYQPVVSSLHDVGDATHSGSSTKKPRKGAQKAPPARSGPTCVESRGSQGRIVWVFSPTDTQASAAPVHLTLGDGSTLTVHPGDQPVAWALFDVHLSGQAMLDYCNLCAFVLIGSVLVCFGLAGETGEISINDSKFEVVVPKGAEPQIEMHEGITIVVCNQESIDATYVGSDAVYVGTSGLDTAGEPIVHPQYARITRISADGEKTFIAAIEKKRGSTGRTSASRPAISSWSMADTSEYVNGTSDRYALIDGPAEMQTLGAPAGYGWLRLKLSSSKARTAQAGFFEAADRLHIFQDGAPRALLGVGPGAAGNSTPLSLRKGSQTLTVLIDNLGRGLIGGVRADRKGLFGHIHLISPFRAGAPKLVSESPVRILSAFSPLMAIDDNETTDAHRLTWTFQHRKKTPLILSIESVPAHGLLILNDKPIHPLTAHTDERIVLTTEQLIRGGNKLQIALNADVPAIQRELKAAVTIFEGVESLTEKAEWAFARWEPPAKSRFESQKTTRENTGRPCWWRAEFSLTDTDRPLYFEARGLTKGRLFLNGHDIGRYWVGAPKVKSAVPPQSGNYLPEPWLRTDEPNELVLFEEHGHSPAKCRLTYDGA